MNMEFLSEVKKLLREKLRHAKLLLTSKDASVCPLINMGFTQSAITVLLLLMPIKSSGPSVVVIFIAVF